MGAFCWVLILILLHAAESVTCGAGSVDKLGILLPLSADGDRNATSPHELVRACSAMLAIEHSNQNDGRVVPQLSSSPPLHINSVLNDTGGDPAMGVLAYRALLGAGVSALVGAGISAVSAPVSLLGAHDALPMVGGFASSTTLSDSGADGLYANYARVFESDAVTARILAPMIKVFNWRHFSIMSVVDVYGQDYARVLKAAARELEVHVTSHAVFDSGDRAAAERAVKQLKSSYQGAVGGTHSNIIVLVAHNEDMEAIFTEADEQGLLKWPYVWLVSDGISTARANRLPEDLASKLNGVLQLQISPAALPGFAEYKKAWQQLKPADCTRLVPEAVGALEQSDFDDVEDVFGAYAYDAAAAAALAMRNVSADGSIPSNAASYGARLNEAIRALDFSGATGRVCFASDSGDRAPRDQELVLTNWLWEEAAHTLVNSVTVLFKLSDVLAAENRNISLVELSRDSESETNPDGTVFRFNEANVDGANPRGTITWLGGRKTGLQDETQWPQDAIQAANDEHARAQEERRRILIGVGVAFLCLLVLAIFLFIRLRRPELFRKTIKLVSVDDGAIVPNVTYITDIEGNWEFFERYVAGCEALSFPSGHPEFGPDGAADIVLAEGWRFVHGGDTCDKGGVVGGSIRVVSTLCKLKRKYPNRVVLLLGNRDLNKLRLSSELDVNSRYYARELVEGPPWLPIEKRVTPEMFLRRLLAQRLHMLPEEVPDEAVDEADTLPNRIRWMYKETMGAEGEFERQWAEQALLRQVDKESLSESEVAQAIYRSVLPGGALRELLSLGQLAFVHMDTLFVHGGLVGGPWEGSADGVDCLGYVPGREERVSDVRQWVQLLNEWKQHMLAEWQRQPFWIEPSPLGGRAASDEQHTTTAGKPRRAADAIMDYVAPGCVPSVVMGRHQDKQGMPTPVPPELVDRLHRERITKLAVGHTPQGNAPTTVQCSGLSATEKLLVVAADTSFSDMSAADKRGDAFSEVQFLHDSSVRVFGVLQDNRVISFALPDPNTALVGFSLPVLETLSPEKRGGLSSSRSTQHSRDEALEQSLRETLGGKRYHIKAWMPEERAYLLYNVNGFVVSYLALSDADTQLLFTIARREGKPVPTEQFVKQDSKLTDSERLAIIESEMKATFERISQARMRLARQKSLGKSGFQHITRSSGIRKRLRRILGLQRLGSGSNSSSSSSGTAIQLCSSAYSSASVLQPYSSASLGRDSHSNNTNGSNAKSAQTDVSVMAPGDTDIIGLHTGVVSHGLEALRKEMDKNVNHVSAATHRINETLQAQSKRLRLGSTLASDI